MQMLPMKMWQDGIWPRFMNQKSNFAACPIWVEFAGSNTADWPSSALFTFKDRFKSTSFSTA